MKPEFHSRALPILQFFYKLQVNLNFSNACFMDLIKLVAPELEFHSSEFYESAK